MKKYRGKTKITGLFLCMLTLMLLLGGCTGEKGTIIREIHKRDENISRNFEMLTMEYGSMVYHTEIAVADKESKNLVSYEEELLEVKNLAGKIEKAAKAFSLEKADNYTDIYFVENAPEGRIYFYKNAVLIDKEILATNQFASSLIGLLYDCEEWVGYGMNGYINDVAADEVFLKEYYSKEENIADLSLFGGKFYELNEDEEERKAVQETAISLFAYIAKEKDVKVLFETDNSSTEQIVTWKNEWLQKRNSQGIYENERETVARSVRFYPGNWEYPVRMYWNQCMFHLNETAMALINVTNMSDFESEALLALEDAAGIDTYLCENLPTDLYKEIEKNKVIYYCYFRDTKITDKSYAATELGWVSLTNMVSFPHEYTHMLTGTQTFGRDSAWLVEGLAENLGAVRYGKSNARDHAKVWGEYLELLKENPGEQADWFFKVDDLYRKLGGVCTEDEFDFRLFEKALVYTMKATVNAQEKPWITWYELESVYNTEIKNGTGSWSYEESELFVAYLMERFGIEKVMQLNFNYSEQNFKEIFGDTLLNLHAEWEQELVEECVMK